MPDKKADIIEELQQLAPGLEPFLNEGERVVPEGYFTELEASILQKVPAKKIRILRPYLYLTAAAVQLVIAGAVFLIQHGRQNTSDFATQLAALNDEELIAILEYEVEDLSAEELIQSGMVDDYSPLEGAELLEAVYEEKEELPLDLNNTGIIDHHLLDSLNEDEIFDLLDDPFGI